MHDTACDVEGYLLTRTGVVYRDEEDFPRLFEAVLAILEEVDVLRSAPFSYSDITECAFSLEESQLVANDCLYRLRLKPSESRVLFEIVYALIEKMAIDDTLPYRDHISLSREWVCLTRREVETQCCVDEEVG